MTRSGEIVLQAALRAAKTITEWIYPSNIYCMSCGNIIDNTRPYSLCDSCIRTFRWSISNTCAKCGKPLRETYGEELCLDCLEDDHSFFQGFSCLQYGDEERKLIHRFKYREEAHLGWKMADAMYDRISAENLKIDLVLPVPMHIKKERLRGYNQAYILAKRIAYKGGWSCEKRLLLRAIETEAMSTLNREERKANIKNVFAVAEGKEGLIEGKTVLLVDDIYTTGSTVDACTEALLLKKANKIYVCAFAAGK